MTKDQAIETAKSEAKKQKTTICVVHDPLGMMEQDGTPYGYGPPESLPIIFAYAAVIGEANADGIFTACEPRAVDEKKRASLGIETTNV